MRVGNFSIFKFTSSAIAFATISVFPSLVDPVVFTSFAIIFVTALVAFTATILSRSFNDFYRGNTAFVCFIIFLAIFALTRGVLSDNPYESTYGVYTRHNGSLLIVSLCLILLAVSSSYSKNHLDYLVNLLLVLGLAQSSLAISQYLGYRPFEYENLYHPMLGTFGNPNYLSAFLGFCSLTAIYVLLKHRDNRFQLNSSLLLLPLAVSVFIVSQSIQGLGMVAIGSALLFLLSSRTHRETLLRATLTLCAGTLAILGAFGQGPLSILLSQQSNVYRWHYWEAAIAGIIDRPLFGFGPDQFRDLYYIHRTPTSLTDRPGVVADNAHNLFLQIGSTYGLIFLSLFSGLIIFIAIRGIRSSVSRRQEPQILWLTSMWGSFLFCTLLSVETSSIMAWGFLFGGCILGISQDSQSGKPKSVSRSWPRVMNKNNQIKVQESLFYMALTLSVTLALTILVPPLKSINLLTNLTRNYSLNSTQGELRISNILFFGHGDRNQLLRIAEAVYQSGDASGAKDLLETFSTRFPSDFRFLDYLAQLAETEGQLELALAYRLEIAEINPKFLSNLQNLKMLSREINNTQAYELANDLYQSVISQK